MSCVNAYCRVITAEEDFNNEVVKMTHWVRTRQPLSPVTLVIALWVHEQSDLVAVQEGVHRFRNMYFYSPRLVRLWSPTVTNLNSSRAQH